MQLCARIISSMSRSAVPLQRLNQRLTYDTSYWGTNFDPPLCECAYYGVPRGQVGGEAGVVPLVENARADIADR